jgi:hypothetical protein
MKKPECRRPVVAGRIGGEVGPSTPLGTSSQRSVVGLRKKRGRTEVETADGHRWTRVGRGAERECGYEPRGHKDTRKRGWPAGHDAGTGRRGDPRDERGPGRDPGGRSGFRSGELPAIGDRPSALGGGRRVWPREGREKARKGGGQASGQASAPGRREGRQRLEPRMHADGRGFPAEGDAGRGTAKRGIQERGKTGRGEVISLPTISYRLQAALGCWPARVAAATRIGKPALAGPPAASLTLATMAFILITAGVRHQGGSSAGLPSPPPRIRADSLIHPVFDRY